MWGIVCSRRILKNAAVLISKIKLYPLLFCYLTTERTDCGAGVNNSPLVQRGQQSALVFRLEGINYCTNSHDDKRYGYISDEADKVGWEFTVLRGPFWWTVPQIFEENQHSQCKSIRRQQVTNIAHPRVRRERINANPLKNRGNF